MPTFKISKGMKEKYTSDVRVILPQNIWNLDKTGIVSVVKTSQVLAEKGRKQVGRITSAERGVTVTMYACVNAIGNALPPAFVAPRVHFQDRMLRDAPPGSLGLACRSGWMTTEIFPEVLAHFIRLMKVSKSNPAILLMDNHTSHISLGVFDMSRSHGLHILTFPPHCSHKLQHLDVSVFGPFKREYASQCDSWLTSHPEKVITLLYTKFAYAGAAFTRSFSMLSITAGFRATGVYSFDPNIFPDDAFLPSAVTDILYRAKPCCFLMR
ncbi:uncharacterized protein LOC144427221 [Styela clava]